MKFGRMRVDDTVGAILGHSTSAGKLRLKKGHVLSITDVEALLQAGVQQIFAGRLDPDDVAEDIAATMVANAALGPGVKTNAAFTGRANLYAEIGGIVQIDPEGVTAINLVDESVTIATVPSYDLVEPGQMLATIKIIPFAAPRTVVELCVAQAKRSNPLVRVMPLRDHAVGLVMTALPETKKTVLDKTESAVRNRLEALGSHLQASLTCAHHEDAIGEAIGKLAAQGLSPLLVFGASAIVDRRDVVPAGIVKAGGEVDHFGMPVDPGNLLLLGHIGDTPIIGVPGCGRSPKINGFDWVLQRLLADIKVTPRDIMLMGSGGLLKEIPSRPMPREGVAEVKAPSMPKIAGLVLAAGQSRRMGVENKLLLSIDGKPMVSHIVDALLTSGARPIIVVVGHQANLVQDALAGRDVHFVENPLFAQGLSTSLRTGITAVPSGIDGALVCLADMPRVRSAHLDKLIAAFNPVEGRAIIVPTKDGKRGNPVLWAARFFPYMAAVAGDVGAKHLIGEHADLVREVPMDDSAVLFDIDTPETLRAAQSDA